MKKQDEAVDLLRQAVHDFKNPLTSVRTIAQIFKLNLDRGSLTQDPQKLGRNCRMLIDQTDKLSLLAEVLVGLFRLNVGGLNLERKPCDLIAIVKHAFSSSHATLVSFNTSMESLIGQWDDHYLELALSFILLEMESATVTAECIQNSAKLSFSGTFKGQPSFDHPNLFFAKELLEMHQGTIIINTDAIHIDLPLSPT